MRQRTYLWKQIAEMMLQELVLRPSAQMPGVQIASGHYNVSKKTIIKAYHHLETIGVLEPVSRGCKRRVNQRILEKIATQHSIQPQLAIFVSSTSLDEGSEMLQVNFEALQSMCLTSNIDFKFVKAPASTSDLKTLIHSLEPQMIILYVPEKGVAEALCSLNIPTIGIGAECEEITRVNTKYSHLMLNAFKKARAFGHLRISAPLWNKSNATHQSLNNTLEEYFRENNQVYSSSYHLPNFRGDTVEDFHLQLEKLFLHTPPSCLILNVFSDFLMVQSFLSSRKICIPDDVSVILLSKDSKLRYVMPTIAHFDLMPKLIAEIAISKLKEQLKQPQPPEEIDIQPVWVIGGSLANLHVKP